MHISLLALWLLGAVMCATSGAPPRSDGMASIPSKPAAVHAVVVDMPQIIDLSAASPDSWAALPPARTEDRAAAPGQEAKASDDRSAAS